MKEPIAPQFYYDGSLKELAARHVGLIKALLFALIIVPAVCGTAYFVHKEAFYHQRYIESTGSYSTRVEAHWQTVHEVTTFTTWMEGAALVLGWVVLAYGAGNLLFRFYRLSALLYPHVAIYFTLLVLVPWLNLLVSLLLWRAGLRQMRGRGLRVGFFGIDPSRVE